jgi:hypothetical protein
VPTRHLQAVAFEATQAGRAAARRVLRTLAEAVIPVADRLEPHIPVEEASQAVVVEVADRTAVVVVDITNVNRCAQEL